jgi:hypothetical protein
MPKLQFKAVDDDFFLTIRVPSAYPVVGDKAA